MHTNKIIIDTPIIIYSLRSRMIPHCGCADKYEVVDNTYCYNGNPDHLAKNCAVVMRQSFWNGGSGKHLDRDLFFTCGSARRSNQYITY